MGPIARCVVKLMGAADNLMTVELWSLASVASVVLKQADEPGESSKEIGFNWSNGCAMTDTIARSRRCDHEH